eukprot:10987376-Karenia_brevis.AAC.1
MNPELKESLRFWRQILVSGISEVRHWQVREGGVAHLFCDAAGAPPYMGAVLVDEGTIWYTHMAPPEDLVQCFAIRRDKQIMGLELLSIALGLSTFEQKIKHRKVVIHSDNTGSEVALRRGSARKYDHAQLVHNQWLHLAMCRVDVHV